MMENTYSMKLFVKVHIENFQGFIEVRGDGTINAFYYFCLRYLKHNNDTVSKKSLLPDVSLALRYCILGRVDIFSGII